MKSAIVFCAVLLGIAPAQAASPRDVALDVKMAYPESLTSTRDGAVYLGSMGAGAVYRAAPGEAAATVFISKEAGGFGRVLGVLADEKTGTLWVCDNDRARASLKSFDLKTGASRKSYDFPGAGSCNDIALRGGDVFASDNKFGRILKLAAGGEALSVWYTNDPADPSVDGLLWKDGTLYFNTYNGNHLFAIAPNGDGTAGKPVSLTPSMDIFQPDGMRLGPGGRIYLVEGRSKDGNGRLDEVIPRGTSAEIRVIKDGYMVPSAVTFVGRTAYVLEAKFNYQRDPALKGQDPGVFHAYAVPLP
jgi:hypothetical protein